MVRYQGFGGGQRYLDRPHPWRTSVYLLLKIMMMTMNVHHLDVHNIKKFTRELTEKRSLLAVKCAQQHFQRHQICKNTRE